MAANTLAPPGAIPSTTAVKTAKPKFLGAIANLKAAKEENPNHDIIVMPEIGMNWQGRYRPLDKNSPALLPATSTEPREDDSNFQLSRVLTRATQQSISLEVPEAQRSQHETQAMKILFGDEITNQHTTIFTMLKRLVLKWKSRAAQRKNIIPVEHFATDDIQKRAIINHREQTTIELPMPIIWAIKDEVLTVLLNVAKVYRKEFGSKHRLTLDAKRRIEKLRSELGKP